jgi:hypothetical protein
MAWAKDSPCARAVYRLPAGGAQQRGDARRWLQITAAGERD